MTIYIETPVDGTLRLESCFDTENGDFYSVYDEMNIYLGDLHGAPYYDEDADEDDMEEQKNLMIDFIYEKINLGELIEPYSSANWYHRVCDEESPKKVYVVSVNKKEENGDSSFTKVYKDRSSADDFVDDVFKEFCTTHVNDGALVEISAATGDMIECKSTNGEMFRVTITESELN